MTFATSTGLALSTTPRSSPPGATAFRINYSFMPGNNYNIAITAVGNLSLQLRASVVPNLNSFNTSSTSSCTPDGNANSYQPAGVGQFIASTSSNSTVYNIPQFTVPGTSGFPFLMIWSSGGQPNLNLDVLHISKIVITQTPVVSFSISSSINTMACGATNPVIYTINNNSNTSGITSYIWNIGASPNGWLFNGLPAPASIQVTSSTLSSLTLTPDCGKSLSNISASVLANGINYNTNNSTNIGISTPTYSISGNNLLCSGSSEFLINGTVCSSIIQWSQPPPNFGTLNNLTTSPTTLTFGGTSGNISLSANITSCGITSSIAVPVKVGPYLSSDYVLTANSSSTQPLQWCPNITYGFSVNGQGSNFLWTVPSGWTSTYNGGYFNSIRAPGGSTPPTGTVGVNFTEPCGNTVNKAFFVAFSTSACNGTDPRFTFSPNPAPSFLNISVASNFTSSTRIRRIQIVRLSTGTTIFDQNYGTTGVLSTLVSTSSFQLGTHSLRIFDGSIWTTYQFIR